MPSPTASPDPRRDRRDDRITALLTAAAAIVPAVFWIGIDESFVAPKLAVASAVAAACAIVLAMGTAALRPQPTFLDVAALVFAVLLLLSYWASVDRAQSFWGEEFQRQGLFTAGIYLAFYTFARVAVGDRRRLRVLVHGISLGGVPVAVYAVAQRAGLDPLWDDIPGGRVFSTIGQTNSLAAYLATVLPVSLGLAIGRRQVRVWAIVGVQAAALVFTESRGGYVGAVAGLAVFAILIVRYGRVDRRQVSGIVVVIAAAVAVTVMAVPGLSDSSGRAWNRALSADEWTSGSVRNHLDLWKVAEAVIADDPLLGTGPDTFPLVFGDHRDEVLPADSAARLRAYRVESPHNIVLAHAAGSGIPAAAAFLLVIVGSAVLGAGAPGSRAGSPHRGGPVEAGVIAGVCGGVVASLFITADFSTTWLLWISAGALVAVTAADERAGRYGSSASISGGSTRSAGDAGPHSTSV